MKSTTLFICLCIYSGICLAQDTDIPKKLKALDKEMEANLNSWSMPGVGIGIVKNGKLVLS